MPGLTCEQKEGARKARRAIAVVVMPPRGRGGGAGGDVGQVNPRGRRRGVRSRPHRHPHSPPNVRAGQVPPQSALVFNTYSNK